MKPRIVFVIMSAVHSADVVSQLARSLAPHAVLVHHDFGQTPGFAVDAPNASFVPNPKRTGWDSWGFSEGIIHSMRFAVEHLPFDYLQVLSPTCLPIRPLADFERYIAANRADGNFSCVGLRDDDAALMTVGCRAIGKRNSLKHRALRRLGLIYFGGSTARTDVAGVQLRALSPEASGWPKRLVRPLAKGIVRAAMDGAFGWHPFTDTLKPYYGSTWFGLRRHVVTWMLDRFAQDDIQRHFPDLVIPDEFLFATLLGNSGFRTEPSNHYIATFNEANPVWLGDERFDDIRTSGRYFGRKFPDDIQMPIRRRVLSELVRNEEAARYAGAGQVRDLGLVGSS